MKNTLEWLIEFDRAYDNIASHKAPGLENYEKSLYLTNSQEIVVLGIANGTLGDAFETTESISNYIAPLVKQDMLEEDVTSDLYKIAGEMSHIYEMPKDLLLRTYEECVLHVSDSCPAQAANIVPVTQDEFWRTSRNPFKGPSESRVLRLVYATSSEKKTEQSVKHYTELVSKYDISSYLLRYIRRPNPIILEDLHGGLSIRGEKKAMTCELDESLHQIILNQAVKMAKEAWSN